MSSKILNTEIAMPLDLPFECGLNLALRLLWIVPFDFQFDRLALAVTQQCELDPVNPYDFCGSASPPLRLEMQTKMTTCAYLVNFIDLVHSAIDIANFFLSFSHNFLIKFLSRVN